MAAAVNSRVDGREISYDTQSGRLCGDADGRNGTLLAIEVLKPPAASTPAISNQKLLTLSKAPKPPSILIEPHLKPTSWKAGRG
jgi:hypothetical protein